MQSSIPQIFGNFFKHQLLDACVDIGNRQFLLLFQILGEDAIKYSNAFRLTHNNPVGSCDCEVDLILHHGDDPVKLEMGRGTEISRNVFNIHFAQATHTSDT